MRLVALSAVAFLALLYLGLQIGYGVQERISNPLCQATSPVGDCR